MLLRRMLLVSCALCSGGLRAAFELSAQLPASFADGPVTLSRESLEARELKPVVTARLVGGRLSLRVEQGPGLFNLSVGGADISFVAADGQALRVTVGAEGRGLRVIGGADQALFVAYEAFRAESLARLVFPVREAIAARQATGDLATVTSLTEKEVAAYREHRRELNEFTVAKLRGSAALYAASLRWDGDDRLEALAGAVRDFAGKFPEAEISRLMEERIARFRVTAIGAVAPELAGASPEGATVSLKELRGRFVLVDFWAEWCGPCKAIAPVLTEIAKEQAGVVTIAKLNVDDYGDIAQRFGVMSIPTLLVFNNGEMKKKMVGAKGKTQLLAEIAEFIPTKN